MPLENAKRFDRTTEDVGNIVMLEHVNTCVPDQTLATLFYLVGMGFTRDPFMNVGLNNMWVNVGEQQFHIPTDNQSPAVGQQQVARQRLMIILFAVAIKVGFNRRPGPAPNLGPTRQIAE